MKKLKLSKTSWLILSAGIFIMVLTGLGVARNQQIQDQSQIEAELIVSEARLTRSGAEQQRHLVDELTQLIKESELQVGEVVEWLRATVVSADVAEEFYAIAEYSTVEVMEFKTTFVNEELLGDIGVFGTTVTAEIEGSMGQVVDCVINLNNHFATGYTASVQINVDNIPGGDDLLGEARASITMTIYSDEGEQ